MTMKRGRKPDYADYNGEPVEGLYKQKYKDGRVKNYYYYDSNKKRISCSSDIVLAVQKYSAYCEKQNIHLDISNPLSVKVIIDNKIANADDYADGIIQTLEHLTNKTVSITGAKIDDDVFWQTAEKRIKANLPYAARRLGIPQLAHIDDITPIPKSITLDACLELFLKAKKQKTKRYIIEVKRYFNEFKTIVSKNFAREISYNDISKYNNSIHGKADKLGNPAATVSNKFGVVNAVIRYAKRKTEYKKDLINLLGYLEQLEFLTKEERAFAPITPDEYKLLLSKCDKDIIIKCSVLLGLNCALRWTDIINLKRTDIDLEKQTLKTFRHKQKKEVIACCLWQETVDAIKEYQAKINNSTDYVFITQFKQPFKNYDSLRNRFDRVKAKAGLNHIKHPLLRKTFATTSTLLKYGSSTDEYKTVMGRRIPGADSAYISKLPENTKDVVNSIHTYFFTDADI